MVADPVGIISVPAVVLSGTEQKDVKGSFNS